MAEMFLTYRGVVYPHQCDHMGHMNVMWYVAKFDEATWGMFAAFGLDSETLRQHGWGIAATRQELSYRQELYAGDSLSITTGVVSLRPRQIKFYHEMLKDKSQSVASACAITGLLIDIHTRKPALFPDFAIQAAQGWIIDKALLV